jgi:uncharacterized membrane protein
MGKGRLEAFSDGVIAVIITIMVLELKAPHGNDLAALEALVPMLLTYVVSFVFVGIYWNNHHHMLHAAARIDGRVLWANLHLLFWLSLIPFITSWVGDSPLASIPTALYGGVLLMAGVAWLLLQRSLVKLNGRDSALARAVGRDVKGKVSALLYSSAVVLAFVKTWIADAIYVFVAMMWLIPDRRIERTIRSGEAPAPPTP